MFEEPSNGIHGPRAKAARKIAWDDAVALQINNNEDCMLLSAMLLSSNAFHALSKLNLPGMHSDTCWSIF